MQTIQTMDEYIAQFSPDLQSICQKIRAVIHEAAPKAIEKISYGIPTFYQDENLIHFGVAKNHIGLYPASECIVAFADRLSTYITSKGAIQLPLNQPIPYDLITEITRYRVAAVQQKGK